mgnify:CR=1 FL=1
MIFVIAYVLISVALAGAAFALIFRNLRDIDKIEKGEYNIREKTTFVTKSVHPEMEEVEVGDELLVVRFDEPKRCAMPNLNDSAMLTCSPPLSDSNSNMVALE